jgi:predicted transcriptional regulator
MISCVVCMTTEDSGNLKVLFVDETGGTKETKYLCSKCWAERQQLKLIHQGTLHKVIADELKNMAVQFALTSPITQAAARYLLEMLAKKLSDKLSSKI